MPVEITRLANGLTVISQDYPQLETVALGVWVKAGARDETSKQGGLAHLLEHMAFKGTEQRSALQIAEEIEAAGGEINAATAMESTAYYARVLKNDWPLALDILADILTHPVFDPAELEREKGVILQEIAAAHDTPDDLVFDVAQDAAFPGHALGRSILGKPERVADYRPAAIAAYRGRHYGAARMVVSAAGRIAHADLVAAAGRLLGDLPAGVAPGWTTPAFAGGSVRIKRKLDQAHMVFTLPGLPYLSPDIYAMQVLAGLLGAGMSSRLFQELRERRGLCYSVFSYASSYADAGLLNIYVATASDKVNEVWRVTADIVADLAGRVGEDEVQRAAAQLKAGLVMSLESTAGRADQLARQYLAFGRVPDIADITGRIDAVTPADIRRLAAAMLSSRRLGTAAVGALGRLAVHDKIADAFF
jgi:predicted Zn-dependent peptidase